MPKKDKKTKSEITKTTLKELGPVLPMGVEENGSKGRSLEVRPWRMKEEKELGVIREDNKNAGIGMYVSKILATMCTSLGGWDFGKIKFNERLLRISQMWGGDVFYAYCWLRYMSLGKTLSLGMTCRRCKEEFDWDADLDGLPISVADSIDAFMKDYELKNPFEIRGKKIRGFKLGPQRWSSNESITANIAEGLGSIKSGVITGCIHGILDDEKFIALMDNDLDDMTKLDIETISSTIDKTFLGPDMSVEVKCPRCRHTFIETIDWSYDNFFGISSR